MASLIRLDNAHFGGNCPADTPPPAGYRLAPHDPPAGMIAPVWDDATNDWRPGTPTPITLPWLLP
jgi:hypothetical protein